ncbi:MAG: ABC transporter ATP-binding protein [Candidatus Thiodiazotropha sp.]
MSLLKGQALRVVRRQQALLDGVDIALQPGELLGLIGPNGAGKSTLLRLLAGIRNADSGGVLFRDAHLGSYEPATRARHIAYLPQAGDVAWPMSVERLVTLGRTPHLGPWQQLGPGDRAIIDRVLERTDLLGLRERPYDTLSGGEQARVRLARALATEADVLLADEPVATLDPAHQLDVMDLLREICDAGRAVIVVLHDLSLAAHYCDRLHLLHRGRTLAEGNPGEVLCEENLQSAYAITLDHDHREHRFKLPWRRQIKS